MKKRLSTCFYPFVMGIAVGSFVPHARPTLHVPTWITVFFAVFPWVALIGFWLWLKVKMGSDMSRGGGK